MNIEQAKSTAFRHGYYQAPYASLRESLLRSYDTQLEELFTRREKEHQAQFNAVGELGRTAKLVQRAIPELSQLQTGIDGSLPQLMAGSVTAALRLAVAGALAWKASCSGLASALVYQTTPVGVIDHLGLYALAVLLTASALGLLLLARGYLRPVTTWLGNRGTLAHWAWLLLPLALGGAIQIGFGGSAGALAVSCIGILLATLSLVAANDVRGPAGSRDFSGLGESTRQFTSTAKEFADALTRITQLIDQARTETETSNMIASLQNQRAQVERGIQRAYHEGMLLGTQRRTSDGSST